MEGTERAFTRFLRNKLLRMNGFGIRPWNFNVTVCMLLSVIQTFSFSYCESFVMTIFEHFHCRKEILHSKQTAVDNCAIESFVSLILRLLIYRDRKGFSKIKCH